jgi:hypothetical protein
MKTLQARFNENKYFVCHWKFKIFSKANLKNLTDKHRSNSPLYQQLSRCGESFDFKQHSHAQHPITTRPHCGWSCSPAVWNWLPPSHNFIRFRRFVIFIKIIKF